MRIRAAVLNAVGAARPYADSRPLGIEELELEPPGPGEVLVRIRAAGLCHSDLSVINGDRPRPTPMALGHEAAGVVEEVGPGVDDLARRRPRRLRLRPVLRPLRPVRRGTAGPVRARQRRRTGPARCSAGARRLRRPDGSPVHHHLGVSAFADSAVVSRRSLVKVDPELPLEEAALFGCAVLTGVGAVVNTAQVRAGASVAVIGLGGVGLCSLLGAARGGRARGGRGRPQPGEARLRAPARRHGDVQRRATRTVRTR